MVSFSENTRSFTNKKEGQVPYTRIDATKIKNLKESLPQADVDDQMFIYVAVENVLRREVFSKLNLSAPQAQDYADLLRDTLLQGLIQSTVSSGAVTLDPENFSEKNQKGVHAVFKQRITMAGLVDKVIAEIERARGEANAQFVDEFGSEVDIHGRAEIERWNNRWKEKTLEQYRGMDAEFKRSKRYYSELKTALKAADPVAEIDTIAGRTDTFLHDLQASSLAKFNELKARLTTYLTQTATEFSQRDDMALQIMVGDDVSSDVSNDVPDLLQANAPGHTQRAVTQAEPTNRRADPYSNVRDLSAPKVKDPVRAHFTLTVDKIGKNNVKTVVDAFLKRWNISLTSRQYIARDILRIHDKGERQTNPGPVLAELQKKGLFINDILTGAEDVMERAVDLMKKHDSAFCQNPGRYNKVQERIAAFFNGKVTPAVISAIDAVLQAEIASSLATGSVKNRTDLEIALGSALPGVINRHGLAVISDGMYMYLHRERPALLEKAIEDAASEYEVDDALANLQAEREVANDEVGPLRAKMAQYERLQAERAAQQQEIQALIKALQNKGRQTGSREQIA